MQIITRTLYAVGAFLVAIGWCTFLLAALAYVSLCDLIKSALNSDRGKKPDYESVTIQKKDDLWCGIVNSDGGKREVLGRSPGEVLRNLRSNRYI